MPLCALSDPALPRTCRLQYRYGGSMLQAMKLLYKDGGGGIHGVLRFYRGYAPALLQGPLSRFGSIKEAES
jgi:hypothetical protein